MNKKPIKKTSDFVFFWKSAGVPTTFGNQKSFLDMVDKKSLNLNLKEFWLLNRLDNDTTWLLYFAKDKNTFEIYKHKQKLWKVIKTYYATVYWKIRQCFFWIKNPIWHHKDDIKKMTVNSELMRWNLNSASTYCEVIWYDQKNNLTELKVEITKWVRHQIRCHLANFGHPILNDKLYCNKKFRKKLGLKIQDLEWNLWLISIGLQIL